jgi:hypothetical protein
VRRAPVRTAMLCCALAGACGDGKKQREQAAPGAATGSSGAAANAACPPTAPAPSPLPRVEPVHRTLAYWLERTSDLDEVLLDVDQIRDMNASLVVERGDDWHGGYDLQAPVDRAKLAKDVGARLSGLHGKLVAKELLETTNKPLPADVIAHFDPALATSAQIAPELRVALDIVPIRCGPTTASFFAKPGADANINPRFDRNNCSTAHPQEVIQILATWPGGTRLARTRYATGWIAPDAKLSPPLPEPLQRTYVHGPRVQADADLTVATTGAKASCPAGTLLPVVAGGRADHPSRVHFASATGFHESDIARDRVQPTVRPLTRRALFTEAFRFLDTPFGWGGGGTAGGHDCSAFLMDLFATFDVQLPRHSSWQTRAGTFSIDVSKVASLDERTRLIDAAAKRGVVLLGLPGHIMLYLGRTKEGTPMVIHAIAEYLDTCKGGGGAAGGETAFQIDRITVSDLELGRGTSRKSLLERLTRITVIGKAPGRDLAGAAELRPAAPVAPPAKSAKCRDSDDMTIFSSPRIANAKQPLRVIVSANRDPSPAELVLFDPSGHAVKPSSLVKLAGGPPWSVIATVDAPAPGAWTAVLGDGTRIEACKRVGVRSRAPAIPKQGRDPSAPAWEVSRAWNRSMENLYSTFVQRLFDFPPDQDLTWPNLHVLLRDPAHNILFDHLQLAEETKLELEPDCAELPYLLRAYFAWKLGLPFAYHDCTRGTERSKPVCNETYTTNLVPRDLLDDKAPKEEDNVPLGAVTVREESDGVEEVDVNDVTAFSLFWSRHAARGVHAASGRTVPDEEVADYYPVSLTREALKPGTAYHDPFGHVMVIASWVRQSTTSYGILLAADAQPDGTVGRKRFWRGNFLFTPETKVAGAGFKAFRPVIFDRDTKLITLTENKELRRSRVFAPFALQQYEGTADTFYDTVGSLIDPRPLDPIAAMNALVDSLHSQAKLRVVSVKNGEDWIAAHPGQVIPIPDGSDIFLTSGPWEDFATPSRDFRLLVAIDTVLDAPAAVKRAPQRFAIEPGQSLDATVAKVEQELDKALRARSIEYVRSDGKTQTVTLRELVDRRTGFEMSYNPNDCVEVRWAAVAGSPEAASCTRHAPADQQAKMATYRPWFRERRRPAR